MKGKAFLSAFAGVATMAVLAGAQDPSFEFPAAKHVGFDAAKDELTSWQQGAGEKVSASFTKASIREVLEYLKNQGINFVVGDDQVDKDKTININVVNVPVEELMRSLGRAWDGRWERQKDVWVFKKGGAFYEGGMTISAPAMANTELFKTMTTTPAEMSKIEFMAPAMARGAHPMSPEQQKEFEAHMKTWARDMEKWGEQFKHFDGKDSEKMSPEQKAQFKKEMEQMMRSMPKMDPQMFGPMKGMMDPKAMEELHMKLGNMEGFKMDPKAMEELHIKLSQAEGFKMDPKAMEELHMKLDKVGGFKIAPQAMEEFHLSMPGKGWSRAMSGSLFAPGGTWVQSGDGQVVIVGPDGQRQVIDTSKSGTTRVEVRDGKVTIIDSKGKRRVIDVKKSSSARGSRNMVFTTDVAREGGNYRVTRDGDQITVVGRDGRAQTVRAGGGDSVRYTKVGDQIVMIGPDGKHKVVAVDSAPDVRLSRSGSDARVARMGRIDLKAIFESLTPSQEATMKKQGFLYFSDLMPKQRAMLGAMSGDWTVSYKDGNRALTIKSDR